MIQCKYKKEAHLEVRGILSSAHGALEIKEKFKQFTGLYEAFAKHE